jgi:hypothetical protein
VIIFIFIVIIYIASKQGYVDVYLQYNKEETIPTLSVVISISIEALNPE